MSRKGFTLIELVLATALGALVLIALTNLAEPLARAQARTTREQTAQAGVGAAMLWTNRALREASWIGSPRASGGASDRLEGCRNAAPSPDGAGVALDPVRPARWFALCVKDGRLYRHEGDGCPPAYSCGAGAADAFGSGAEGTGFSASFTRASAFSATIDVAMTATSHGSAASARTSIAVAAAAGTNQ